MINGAHVIIFSRDAERLREWFRDVVGLRDVDAGDGWLIFALPPAELAVHPADAACLPDGRTTVHQLYLMCDDIEATVNRLQASGVMLSSPITDRGWGLLTALKVPGGGELGLYQPKHASPISEKREAREG